MFLVTFACADIMNVSRAKITSELEFHLVIKGFLYVAGIEEYKLDTFCITDCEMFYEMIALYAGKVSNYFRHYLLHFLTGLKQKQLFQRANFVFILINYRYCC